MPTSWLAPGEARKTAGSLLSVGLLSRAPGMPGMPAAPRGLELLEVHPPCWLSAAMEHLTPWTMDGILQSWMDRIAYSHTPTTVGSPRVSSGGPHPWSLLDPLPSSNTLTVALELSFSMFLVQNR